MNISTLSDVLHQLMHAYKRELRSGIQRHRISLPITHIRVLKIICRVPETTARLIARRMNQDKAQITRVLNGLIESGLIEKTENPNDLRSQYLLPTKAGMQMLSKINAIEKQAAVRMTRNLRADELETFVHISGVMIDNSTGAHGEAKEVGSNG